MPVYDLGYRAYKGPIQGRLLRWWPIAWRCFRASLRWPFIVTAFLATFPMFFRCLHAYAIGLASSDPGQMTEMEAKVSRLLQRVMPDRFSFDDTLFASLLSEEIFGVGQ